jgi:5-methylcytosine-specific restriction endonuclease McrA
MKWDKKYRLNLEEIYAKHLEGFSLPELSDLYSVPRTTLNRYLSDAGYKVFFNRHRCRVASWRRRQQIEEFVCPTAWKHALLEHQENNCLICQYDKIVEAHHIVPQSQGGKSMRDNGILLCPNHHAEAHAGLLDKKALAKLSAVAAARKLDCGIGHVCDFETRIFKEEEV